MKTIHSRIRDLRKKQGLSLEAFAALVEVSWQSVQQWEREDGTAPTRKRLPAVAKALGVSVEELVVGDRKRDAIAKMADAAQDKMLAQLIELYAQLDQAGRDKLLSEANWLHSQQYPHPSPSNPFAKAPKKRDSSARDVEKHI